MNTQEYEYHLDHLKNMDPDQLVAELDLSTDEILDAFAPQVEQFIRENYG